MIPLRRGKKYGNEKETSEENNQESFQADFDGCRSEEGSAEEESRQESGAEEESRQEKVSLRVVVGAPEAF
ncbi:MAG: hypothetical protein HY314_06220 [Acidobacteria bacterium]|nr:hypothetical protein [Acidobacteriota bacterium]